MACDEGSSLSLVAAVKEKYCCSNEQEDRETLPAHKTIKESALSHRPGTCPVQRRKSIVLDRGGVTHMGSQEELGALCPSVEEAVLATNLIREWRDVCTIFTALPKLSFLDLSHNPLHSDTFTPAFPVLNTSLTTLVLNSTEISWDALQVCLQGLPCLQELHLNTNEYSQVNLDPSFQHTTLKRLHINNNLFSEWTQIEKFSPAFPNLQALVALSNPLSEIAVHDAVFPELTSLNLNGTKISDWTSIEQLNSLPKLSDLALLKLPLGRGMEEKKRRMAVVARMPNLTKLNKSMISDTEREDAERWLIRNREQNSSHPAIYARLVEKYGSLNPLADVDFSAKNEARLEFKFDDRASEIHRINLCQTTLQLKRWLGKRIGMRPSTFRLIYVDAEVVGCYRAREVMSRNEKYLDSYRMKDGDKIEVQMK